MVEQNEDKPNDVSKSVEQDLSKLVSQTIHTLQEVDRRLQVVRGDLSALINRASALQSHAVIAGGLPGAGLPGPGPGAEAGGLRGAMPAPVGLAQAPGAAYGALAGAPLGGAYAPAYGLPGRGLLPPLPPVGLGFLPLAEEGSRSARELRGIPPVARLPSVALVDAGDQYILQAELPGVRKDDLDILVSDRTITVSGQERLDLGEGALLLSERLPTLYRRTLQFPGEVHSSQTQATLKDGVLTIRVPKKVPTEGTRHVDVAYG